VTESMRCPVCDQPLKAGERIVTAAEVVEEPNDPAAPGERIENFHEEHWDRRQGLWRELSRGWGVPERFE